MARDSRPVQHDQQRAAEQQGAECELRQGKILWLSAAEENAETLQTCEPASDRFGMHPSGLTRFPRAS